MPIDFSTGVVVFDDGTTLRPRMRRDETPEPVTYVLDGIAFACWWTFDGDELRLAHLADERFEPYDVQRARELHDAWLDERLGKGMPWNAYAYPFGGIEYSFRWGTVGSYAIPQDYNAYVGIAYT